MEKAVFIGTFVPLVLMLLLLRHSRPVISFFCWGMASFIIVSAVSPPLYAWLGLGKDLNIDAVFVGPPLEELVKGLPLLLLPWWLQRSFVPYYYIFGLASGIGFSVEENIIYLINFGLDESDSYSITLMVLRSFSVCLMHGVATGTIGYMVTKAVRASQPMKILYPLWGWLLASLYHGAFNWSMLNWHAGIGTVVAIIIFGIFFYNMKETESWAPEIQGTNWQ